MAVPLVQRLASALVYEYVRRSPVARGKWRLTTLAFPFLVVPVEDGLYVRVSAHGDAAGLYMVQAATREPDTMRLFTQLLRPGMTVVDAGANIGEYTLVAARRVAPGGSVHAFEPTPAVVDWLRRNVALNDLHNVVINPVALSNAAGDVELFFDPMEPVSNSIVSLWHATGVATVPATTLDEYVGRSGLAAVDVLKIDVEGAEIMALQGAGRLLAGEEAPIIFVEANEGTLARSGRTMRDLIALLEGHGYACGVIDFHGGDAKYSNLLAAKPAHRHRFPVVEPIIARGTLL